MSGTSDQYCFFEMRLWVVEPAINVAFEAWVGSLLIQEQDPALLFDT